MKLILAVVSMFKLIVTVRAQGNCDYSTESLLWGTITLSQPVANVCDDKEVAASETAAQAAIAATNAHLGANFVLQEPTGARRLLRGTRELGECLMIIFYGGSCERRRDLEEEHPDQRKLGSPCPAAVNQFVKFFPDELKGVKGKKISQACYNALVGGTWSFEAYVEMEDGIL